MEFASQLRPTYYLGNHQAIRCDERYHFQSGRLIGASYRIEGFGRLIADPIGHVATAQVKGNHVVEIDIDGDLARALRESLQDAIHEN